MGMFPISKPDGVWYLVSRTSHRRLCGADRKPPTDHQYVVEIGPHDAPSFRIELTPSELVQFLRDVGGEIIVCFSGEEPEIEIYDSYRE